MARRTTEFQTIRSEGGLLPPDLLRRVVDPAGKVPGVEPTAYGLPAGERLNEAITQSWNRLRRHWAEFRTATKDLPEGDATTGLTNDKWSLPLLRELGFGFLATTAGPTIDGKTYAISRFAGNTAIHLVGRGVSLDHRSVGVRGAAAGNPHGLVQEFLNRSLGHLWAIVSNGLAFRILRDNQALSRQSFLEFDIEAMFDGEVYSDFVLLWLIAHATRFLPRNDGRPDSCWLETWSKEAAEQGVAALTDLRGGVEKALEILGQGFVSHPKNTALRDALRKGEAKLSDFHHQLLRVVYRLIFLFVSEDRELEGISILHPHDKSDKARLARERFASHYSTSRLRELASRIKGSRHGDLWRQLQLIVGALSGEERFATMRAALALPPLGSMLWNPAATTLLNGPGLGDPGTELSNVDFLEALRHLAFIRKEKILRPVDYKNLGSEEFGGVYESFLALTPQISSDGARFTFAEFAGNERKTSGSYYTPDSLVQCLLDSALDPVVNERLADAERLARADWSAVEKEIQSDAAKCTYVLAFLTKHAGASKTATAEERKRAWDSVPPTPRRWKLSEEALLAIRVCDQACGSGHFLVGAGHRLARHLARVRAMAQGESEPSPLLYQTALRDVIGHCLYGVDINPMAVELCKVTLWLEALEPGKPLSFLDHHIRCGNSLLGATPELIASGLPDEAFDPIEGDDKAACSSLKKLNRAQREGLRHLFVAEDNAIRDRLWHTASAIEEMGDSRPEDIQRKEAAFRAEQSNYDFQKAWDLANLWCAAFVIRKRSLKSAAQPTVGDQLSVIATPSGATPTQTGLFGGMEEIAGAKARKAKPPSRAGSESLFGITTQHLRDYVESGALPHGPLGEARRLADQYGFFHWHLIFPEILAQGGFDVNLGNPPWEKLQLEEKQFFAAALPQLAEAPATKRKLLILQLKESNPVAYDHYVSTLRHVAGQVALVKNSGRFPLSGGGNVATHSLFTELALSLVRTPGRFGLVVPSGLATQESQAQLFRELVSKGRLKHFYDFENRDGIFPGVHRSYRFSIVVAGDPDLNNPPCYAFFLHDIADLFVNGRRFSLTFEDLVHLGPNTLSCPTFANAQEAALVRRIYDSGQLLLSEVAGSNPWEWRSWQMFNETHEANLMEIASVGGYKTNRIRLYEAKLIHQFEHRFASYQNESPDADAVELSTVEKQNPLTLVETRYIVPSSIWDTRIGSRGHLHKWILAFRQIARATDARTCIFTVVPQTAATSSLPVVTTNVEAPLVACLAANLNSFVFDFVARTRVTGAHLNHFIIHQLPSIPPSIYRSDVRLFDFISRASLELMYTAWDLEAFGRDCGWSGPPFRWDEERRFLLRCELDAAFFHLYLGSEEEWRKQPASLTESFPTPRDAVSYIMNTFPIVKRKDEANFKGDYRTKRTILEIYDALAEAIKTGKPYQTRLDPPPADPRCCHPAKS